jgi:triosephosphate isomerase (TIM)
VPTGRRRMVGVSTKLYFSAARTASYIQDVVKYLRDVPQAILEQVDIFIIPDLLTVGRSAEQLIALDPPMRILVGAQDAFWEDTGAFTGCVSPAVLAELGTTIVEIGHAERRRIFAETDEQVAMKAARVVGTGMIPLICVGEVDAPKEGQDAQDASMAAAHFVERQVQVVMNGLKDFTFESDIVIAYEPVWAIGAAQPADAEHVIRVAKALRMSECLRRHKGVVRIIYGGSAGPGLFEKLSGALDGLFLGRFAHDPAHFCKTIQEVATAPR